MCKIHPFIYTIKLMENKDTENSNIPLLRENEEEAAPDQNNAPLLVNDGAPTERQPTVQGMLSE